jgi:hypothetical protein
MFMISFCELSIEHNDMGHITIVVVNLSGAQSPTSNKRRFDEA